MSKQTKMGDGCQRIESNNNIVTSCLLRLHPLTKIKIIPFFATDKSRTNFYLPAFELFWLNINPSNQFFPSQNASTK